MDKILELIEKDSVRVKALECVFELGLPQCYISAGFVRNLVWDHIHQLQKPTPLNDVDVIYFDPNEASPFTCLEHERYLARQMPELNWQVRNQAIMHERNGDLPYKSSLDAMSYWPEKETAVGVRQISKNCYECVSVFGFESLFHGYLTHNPKRSYKVFQDRVSSKAWLLKWSLLKVA